MRTYSLHSHKSVGEDAIDCQLGNDNKIRYLLSSAFGSKTTKILFSVAIFLYSNPLTTP